MIISSRSSHPKPGWWTIIGTWALMTISLSSCQSAVSPMEPSSEVLEVDPVAATLVDGDTLRIQVLSKNGNGAAAALNPSNQVTWTSSAPEVAVVEKGFIRGIGPGEARVTAISKSGAEASAEITVNPAGPGVAAAISVVSGDSQSGAPGETLGNPLVVKVTDVSGDPVSGVPVSWAVSDAGGTVEALAEATDDQGKVSAVWTLGEEGEPTASAIVEGVGDAAFTAVSRMESSPPPTHGSNGMIPAFPGAEGWGATALNECRELPLVVHQVTNTDDDGPGSFRDVLMNQVRDDRFDVVIFRTGGLIRLRSEIQRSGAHCLYIAGQSAPGEGISLAGHSLEFRASDDMVVRHIRHRGHNPGTALQHRGGSRVVYADISASWSIGRFILRIIGSSSRPVTDATVQNVLLYEPDDSHPTVFGMVGDPKPDPDIRRVTALRNVMMGPGHRLPKINAWHARFVNNVTYNWRGRGAAINNTTESDWIANYMKNGPSNPVGEGRFRGRPFVLGDSCSDSAGSLDEDCTRSVFISNNRNSTNNFTETDGLDPWQSPNMEVTCRNNYPGHACDGLDGDTVPEAFRRFTPLALETPFAAPALPITDAFVDEIVAQAGHHRRLTCDGSWTPVRDAVDAERIEWFYAGTGLIDQIHAGDMDIPVPAAGTPCQDRDGDGIPDEWAKRFFGCPTCADAAAIGRDGYLVMEHYVNGTDPR